MSGSQPVSAQPRGLLPRSLKRSESNGEAVELLIRIAEQWYPGVSNLEELDKKEQKFWIRFREGVLRGQYSVAELAKTLNDSITKHVDAEIEDVQARREVDLEDQVELRKERKARLKQELKERETRRVNQSRKDHLLMAITAISFLCTIALVAAGATSGQPAAYGGSGIFGLVSAVGVIRLFLSGKDDPPAPPPVAEEASPAG